MIAGAVAIGMAPFLWTKQDAVIPGVRLNGQSASGMTREELINLIREKNKELAHKKILLNHGNVKEEWSMAELKVHYDESSPDDLLSLGKSGQMLSDWAVRWKTLISGNTERSPLVYDRGLIEEKAAALSEKYGKPAENAKPVFHNDGTVTFAGGSPYMKVDKEKLARLVEEFITGADQKAIEIPVSEEKQPDLTMEKAQKFNTVLGQYTTYFSLSPNRSRNIELSARAISEVVIEPGAGFSYNNTTGTRSPEHGYLEAPVIVDGKLEPGYGGGVCQTSTTLFNAVMLAGLPVTERTSHFSPVSYVPIGQDATVSFGYLDFCFINAFKNPVYIYTVYASGELTCYILGDRTDKPQTAEILLQHSDVIPFKTVEKVDSSQKEDKTVEYGHEGYSAGILQYARWADGRIYQNTFESYYEPVDTVITYNKDPKKQKKEEKGKGKKKAQGESKAVKNQPKIKKNTGGKEIPLR